MEPSEFPVTQSDTADIPNAPPSTPALAGQLSTLPDKIGRYRINKVLGKGGFGLVYLGHDDELNRPVAIKVPHRERVASKEDIGSYLTEARTLACLDHPNIVPVFDVGSTPDGLCYVVSKFIEGSDLAGTLTKSCLTFQGSAELVAIIAEALHYAHGKGLVHRDVKPANILLDNSGKPYLADFGLALKETDFGKGSKYCGTPAYMSPEQARGEGHRVDGRSDLFSLAVVLYELLTSRRPFKGDSQAELLDQISTVEARPLRQMNDAIPRELERICLKALSKRASDRYTTGKDFAEDLRVFLSHQPAQATPTPTAPVAQGPDGPRSPLPSPTPADFATPSSDHRPIKIVPKGLRSFDAGDADFFLELLPGPRDRDGLPDSIRFWKRRIEDFDAEKTFTVGLIYGPSGCGKSSLVKAGLLPLLEKAITVVHVEATPDETEARLLKGLRRQIANLPANLGLTESLATLRQGKYLPAGQKLLIVLDQFEQWLHAKKEEQHTELVQALRQCDGSRVQCIVMVRDDFWLAVSRFMKELEVRLVEGENSALVDLFDTDHARKVLAAFGRAFGKLPPNSSETNKEQKAFLTQAVAGLAQEGKIISVRLALFAEMMKGKAWTSSTLKEVGGTEGIGVTFLEETFSAATAPPEHRFHQKAARAVLKSLLPESGTDIKGHMRSHDDLLEASGYKNRTKDFDDLLRILDSEIRLITPTDPEGAESDSSPRSSSNARYYQLTHDYLVRSLREWLTRKQKETRRGRAELLLADRASVWKARPENRQLPSLWQWFQIKWLTAKKTWTPPQRKMMGKAGRYHAVRAFLALCCLTLLGWGGYEGYGRLQANALKRRLLNASTNDVPAIVEDMPPYRRWLDPLLVQANEEAKTGKDARSQLHSSLALLPVDSSQIDYLYSRLLDAEPSEVPVIRDALTPHKDALVPNLWAVVEKPQKGKESQRLRAAAALAKYDAESKKWEKVQVAVANDLVNVPAVYLGLWLDSMRPVRAKLFDPLSFVFADTSRRDVERSLATDILANYAADQPTVLADLLMIADDKQFAVIFPKFKGQGEKALPVLTGEIDKKLPSELPSSDERREKLAKRQANAAVALLRMNQPEKVWPLLKHSPDPRVRSYLIHRLSPLGADAKAVVRRLDEEPDITIRRALILSLGEFSEKDLSEGRRKPVMAKLQDIYRQAADPGLHAAAEWLLRQWKQEAWLKKVNDEWAIGKEQREKREMEVKKGLAPGSTPQWYVNGQAQTMVVIPGPVEFLMGSPLTEKGRYGDEHRHRVRIGRSFAIAAKAVTLEQYSKFRRKYHLEIQEKKLVRQPDLPVLAMDWYQAATYCNWLSKQEGIAEDQWCYEMEYGQAKKLKEGYLGLTGYRLPTEAEVEYATRAGAVTARYFGETEDLLPKYAWYFKNADYMVWPVGSKKPNDLGLFDVHGNVSTWCQETYKVDPDKNDAEDALMIIDTFSRVMRGGSFDNQPVNLRSAQRSNSLPTQCYDGLGLRPARTFR